MDFSLALTANLLSRAITDVKVFFVITPFQLALPERGNGIVAGIRPKFEQGALLTAGARIQDKNSHGEG